MLIPECYGKGIYKYWKFKKDSVKLLVDGLNRKDSVVITIGSVFTTFLIIKDIYNLYKGKAEKTFLPSDQCNYCENLNGCFISAIVLFWDEIRL